MKKKVLIILIVVFIIVALIVTGVVLFKTRSIDVNLTGDCAYLKSEDIRLRVEKFKGKNILGISTSDVRNEIEGAYPYARVTGVSRFFPDTLVVNVEERRELFAIRLQKDNIWGYYYLDKDLRVLKFKEGDTYFDSFPNDNIDSGLVLIEGISDNDIGIIKEGSTLKLNNSGKLQVLKDITGAFFSSEEYLIDYDSEKKIQEFLYSIDISTLSPVSVYVKNSLVDGEERGMKLRFTDNNKNITKQLSVAIGVYNSTPADKRNSNYYIMVLKNKDDSIYRYRAELTATMP